MTEQEGRQDADRAFSKAIAEGRLSTDPKAANHAGVYMYMGPGRRADGKAGDAFKNILSRLYDV